MAANGGADITDAPTACIAIRYTERTAPMAAYPIGACTPTAMIITAIAKSNLRCLRKAQALFL